MIWWRIDWAKGIKNEWPCCSQDAARRRYQWSKQARRNQDYFFCSTWTHRISSVRWGFNISLLLAGEKYRSSSYKSHHPSDWSSCDFAVCIVQVNEHRDCQLIHDPHQLLHMCLGKLLVALWNNPFQHRLHNWERRDLLNRPRYACLVASCLACPCLGHAVNLASDNVAWQTSSLPTVGIQFSIRINIWHFLCPSALRMVVSSSSGWSLLVIAEPNTSSECQSTFSRLAGQLLLDISCFQCANVPSFLSCIHYQGSSGALQWTLCWSCRYPANLSWLQQDVLRQ